jgi:hypothetical protein
VARSPASARWGRRSWLATRLNLRHAWPSLAETSRSRPTAAMISGLAGGAKPAVPAITERRTHASPPRSRKPVPRRSPRRPTRWPERPQRQLPRPMRDLRYVSGAEPGGGSAEALMPGLCGAPSLVTDERPPAPSGSHRKSGIGTRSRRRPREAPDPARSCCIAVRSCPLVTTGSGHPQVIEARLKHLADFAHHRQLADPG